MSDEQLSQLTGMGFPAHCARDALAKSGGNVAAAISRLVGTAAQDRSGATNKLQRSPTGAKLQRSPTIHTYSPE